MAARNSGGDWSVGHMQVQVDDQSTQPSIHHSFIASGRCVESDHRLRWAVDGMRFTAPLLFKLRSHTSYS